MTRAVFTKSGSHTDFVLQSSEDVSAHGGAVIIDALARDFGLWDRLRARAVLDHRSDKSRGFSPEVIIAQILFTLGTGGINIEDTGRLAADTALGRLLGLFRMADASTVNTWLNRQTRESIDALWALNREFIAWTMARVPKVRLLPGGKLEVFFDDTQIEVEGRHFENTAKNYEGNITYSWQTLWTGPFIAAARMDKGSVEPSAHLAFLLDDAKALWEPFAAKGQAHFYADSGSSAGKYLNKIDRRGWEWSVSYNKWTSALDKLAEATPDDQWSPAQDAAGRGGEAIKEQHCWLRHQPGDECLRGHDFACVRYRAADGGDLLWRYAYIVCGQAGGAPAPVHQPAEARAVFPRHHHKGALEHGFTNLLSDLDLHHPPCQRALANEMWYALGALAHNLLRAVQLLHMDAGQQTLRLRQLIRWWMTVPVKLSTHAHRTSARYFVPKATLTWWRVILGKVWPKRPRGRPAGSG